MRFFVARKTTSMNTANWGYSFYPKGKRQLLRCLLPTAREMLVARSVSALSLSAYRRILVAGAGMDPYRRLFPNAQSYLCFDIDGGHENIDVKADAHSMPFRDETCDCVLATEILEHLKEPEKFIDEVYRVLQPGGVVVATIPFMFHQHANPFDYNRPTREALRFWFCKYEEVVIFAQGNRAHALSDLISTAFSGRPYLQAPFVLLRIINHVLAVMDRFMNSNASTAPTGYLVVAEKRREVQGRRMR